VLAMDAISIASSMAGLMSLAKDVLNHLSSSRGRNTPLGRIESRAHELLDEFGILFSLFYAEQTSNVDTPYPAEVGNPKLLHYGTKFKPVHSSNWLADSP